MATDKEAMAQAHAQLQSVKALVAAYEAATEADDANGIDEATQRIHEDALSVEVRDDWRTPGSEGEGVSAYRILLCTGGPAVRIIGTVDNYSEPDTARLQFQDWGTPWTDFPLSDGDEAALLSYARQFYFAD